MQGSSNNDNSTNLQKSLIESPLKVHLRVSEDHSESCDKENNTQTDSETDEIEELAGPVLMQSLKSMRWSVRKQLYSYSTWSHSQWMIGREQNPTFKGIHYAGNSECTQRQEKCWLEAKAKGDEEMCRRHTLKYCIILTGSVRLITFQWHLQQCSKVIFLRKRIPKIKIPRSLQHQTYCLTSQMTSLNAHKPLHSPNPSASWSSPCTCMYTVLHPSCHGSSRF